jgi:hypothetical protein
MASKTRNRWDLIRFLDLLDADIPVVGGQNIVAVSDNLSTRGTAEVERWLTEHPRWSFQFTPKHASWLNQIEIFFSILWRRLLRRGVRHIAVLRIERGRGGRGDGAVTEDAGVGRVLPVGERPAALRVVVGGLDPLFLARHDEPPLAGPRRPGALLASQVVHAALGLRGQANRVGDKREAAGTAGLPGEHLAVRQRVDEPRSTQTAGEPVRLVGPLRVGDRVVQAPPRSRGEIDLALPGPGRSALRGVIEVMRVGSSGIDRVQEGDPLRHGHLKLADAVRTADRANAQAAGRHLRGDRAFQDRSLCGAAAGRNQRVIPQLLGVPVRGALLLT